MGFGERTPRRPGIATQSTRTGAVPHGAVGAGQPRVETAAAGQDLRSGGDGSQAARKDVAGRIAESAAQFQRLRNDGATGEAPRADPIARKTSISLPQPRRLRDPFTWKNRSLPRKQEFLT